MRKVQYIEWRSWRSRAFAFKKLAIIEPSLGIKNTSAPVFAFRFASILAVFFMYELISRRIQTSKIALVFALN